MWLFHNLKQPQRTLSALQALSEIYRNISAPKASAPTLLLFGVWLAFFFFITFGRLGITTYFKINILQFSKSWSLVDPSWLVGLSLIMVLYPLYMNYRFLSILVSRFVGILLHNNPCSLDASYIKINTDGLSKNNPVLLLVRDCHGDFLGDYLIIQTASKIHFYYENMSDWKEEMQICIAQFSSRLERDY